MVRETINEIRSNQKVIISEFKNLKGWMKDIAEQTKKTNGRVNDHEIEIKLIKHKLKIDENSGDKIEKMSRKKLLLWYGAGITFIIFILNIIVELIIKYVRG